MSENEENKPNNIENDIIIIEEMKDYTLEGVLQDRMKEYREVFDLFDKEGNGEIPLTDLESILRTISCQYNEEELKNIIEEIKLNSPEEKKNVLNFNLFCKILSSQLQKCNNKVTEEEIKEFFQIIDKDKNNFISTFDLEAYFGSSLDENNHLINAVLSFANSKENQISFEQLRSFLLS